MLTDLQRRKLTRMFRYIDANQDDVFARSDYDRMVHNLVALIEPPTTASQAAELAAGVAEAYAGEWTELEAAAEREGAAGVTLGVWLAYRDRKLAAPDAHELEIRPYVEMVFALLDSRGEGRISRDDVRRYLGIYALSGPPVEEILARIDPTQAGSFTLADIDRLSWEFYFSKDESEPGNWLLGRF